MEHLRDRVPGRFVRSDNLCSAIGSDFSESIVLNLGGDMARRASTRRYGMPTGSGTTFSTADLCVLKDAAYFDACAQELGLFIDTSLTFELSAAATLCLSPDQWFTSCAPERASCEPAR